MVTKRDYYDVLGVDKQATDEDIKKAYRQQALKYHPDRNKDADASEKFKEVAEAYQVLSDPSRRNSYDQFGHAGVQGGNGGQGFSGFEGFGGFGDVFDAFFGGSTQRGPRSGRDLEYEITISFEESVFGTEKTLDADRVTTCSRCSGSKAEAGTEVERCATCGGSGQVRRVQRNIFGQFQQVTACTTCGGDGRSIRTACKQCKGRGLTRNRNSISVKIPAGVDDRTRVMLRGEGDAGDRGAPAGDLFVYLNVSQHEYFRRSGNNLLIGVDIDMAQAALGDVIKIPTLGDFKDLKIPSGTQSGRVFRMRGEGIPDVNNGRRGDELVEVTVNIPKKLSGRQKELLAELKASFSDNSSDENDGDGFFGTIKDVITGEG